MNTRQYLPMMAMAVLLLIVEAIALYLGEPMDKQGMQAFEDPTSSWNSIIYFAVILVFTAFIMIAFRRKLKWLVQWFILGSIAATLMYVFYPLLTFLPFEANAVLTVLLSVGLTALLYKFPEWYVVDIVGVLIGGGAAAIFGISLAIVPTLLLLLILAVYDAIAVYSTKHMIALAEGVMDLKMPVLLVVPKHLRYSFLTEKFDKPEREAFFMGLGDAVMPTILTVSANMFVATRAVAVLPLVGAVNLPVLGTILGTLTGFAVLAVFVSRGKPQAGLPFLNGGAILGYAAGCLFAGVPLL
ncbi:MAG TPA: hypothetical protein HA257_02375 [Candidatus Methanoperedenaceae archaeon]|nr:hypothetical protein [Candidatus Methanoperedenaceae archaeon]